MTDNKHSALPWHANGGTVYDAGSKKGKYRSPAYVTCYTVDDCIHKDEEESKANAELIVRAVNNHDKLVEMVKRCEEKIAKMSGNGETEFRQEILQTLTEMEG